MSVDFDHLSFFKIVSLNPTLSLFYSRSEVTFKEKGRSKAAHSNSPHLRLNYSRATPLLASLPLSPTVSGLEKKGEGNFAGNDLLVKNRRPPYPPPSILGCGGAALAPAFGNRERASLGRERKKGLLTLYQGQGEREREKDGGWRVEAIHRRNSSETKL